MLSGCKQNNSNEKISVVCTIFPQYDWVRQIVGDKASDMDLTFVINNRIDLHSYQPSVEDIAKISSSDLFIYVGGESDEWVDDALKEAVKKDMVAINLLEELGDAAKEEEIKEGMEEEEHDEAEGDHEDETEYDEHVWLSLKNAQIFCQIIAKAISSLDPDNAEVYQANLTSYIGKLSALDSQYQTEVTASPVKTVVFGDRFPFRYLVNDYGLDYYAAFIGCSAETEASPNTIIRLAEKVDEFKLKTIMVTESSDQSIAKTIKDNTKDKNQQILVLDSLQSVTSNDAQNGTTYLSVMENNLEVLKKALK